MLFRSVGAVLGVVQSPLHVGAEGHLAAGVLQALLQPGWAGESVGVIGNGGDAHGRAIGSGRMLATEAGAMQQRSEQSESGGLRRWLRPLLGVVLALGLWVGLTGAPAPAARVHNGAQRATCMRHT